MSNDLLVMKKEKKIFVILLIENYVSVGITTTHIRHTIEMIEKYDLRAGFVIDKNNTTGYHIFGESYDEIMTLIKMVLKNEIITKQLLFGIKNDKNGTPIIIGTFKKGNCIHEFHETKKHSMDEIIDYMISCWIISSRKEKEIEFQKCFKDNDSVNFRLLNYKETEEEKKRFATTLSFHKDSVPINRFKFKTNQCDNFINEISNVLKNEKQMITSLLALKSKNIPRCLALEIVKKICFFYEPTY